MNRSRMFRVGAAAMVALAVSSWAVGQSIGPDPEPPTMSAKQLGLPSGVVSALSNGPVTAGAQRAAPDVDVMVSGRSLRVPAGVATNVDLAAAEMVHQASWGTTYLVAPGKEIPGTLCVVQIHSRGEARAMVGCDQPEVARAKRGWLFIEQDRRAGTRSGILILPPGESRISASAGSANLASGSVAPERSVVFEKLPATVTEFRVRTAAGERTVTFPPFSSMDQGEPVRLVP